MYVLIVEHDHSPWTVLTYTRRADAEQYIRDLAEAMCEYDCNPPTALNGCIDLLAECNEHVKLFHCPTPRELGNEVAFEDAVQAA